MSPLYRVTLALRSPWRTPWQADTLAGALLATCARTCGPQTLREKLIDPMLAGQPPFVLSDALPADLLPLPIHLRLHRYPEGTNLKAVKRARWLTPEHFAAARAGAAAPANALLTDSDVYLDDIHQHNTLSRFTDTSTDSGDEESAIGIFQKSDTQLQGRAGPQRLTLYFRFASPGAGDLFLDLLHELSLTGFGADVSTGRGQFDLPADPVAASELDSPPPDANAVMSLSTFQPAPHDPNDGYWDAFAKFPKAGPGLALAEHQIRKNTLLLLRPGAVFRTDPATPCLGRAIDTPILFPADVAAGLLERNLRIIHPAFGLVIPLTIPTLE